ncbi:hypothetical protein WMF28_25665 [Sorangium sp. So ce590]|uniref:hypothetical protein n=1 Tax=Sorangium sp. So ce590 TaxID=3133317 RepID=UPI003F631128
MQVPCLDGQLRSGGASSRESAPAIEERSPRDDPDATFVRSGKIYTSAGTTASIDLALSLVEEELGYDVARDLVVLLATSRGGLSPVS